jgi:hypothetical protein
MAGIGSSSLLPTLIIGLVLSVQMSDGAKREKGSEMDNLNSKNTSLVVIDVQKYFIPGYPGAISPAIPGQNEAKNKRYREFRYSRSPSIIFMMEGLMR